MIFHEFMKSGFHVILISGFLEFMISCYHELFLSWNHEIGLLGNLENVKGRIPENMKSGWQWWKSNLIIVKTYKKTVNEQPFGLFIHRFWPNTKSLLILQLFVKTD